METVSESRRVVEEAIRSRVFPAAVVEVGNAEGALWSEAFGTMTFESGSPPAVPGTLFDLASLTKVIATTSLVMDLVARKAVALEERVSTMFSEWRGRGREHTSVADLLWHASGLPARLIDAPPIGRRAFEHEICAIALEYEPRTMSLYSDLDFILLGFLIADRGGAPLSAQFSALAQELALEGMTYEVARDKRSAVAPTIPLGDDLRRGRQLAGEVHDSYAAALGGAAGHAGLFGAAPAVGIFARGILQALRGAGRWPRELMGRFITKSAVAGSSRALGWDTMLPTSSCGERMSKTAIGHTGFTGTSLWIDHERDRYFILLSNRVCDGGTLEQMRAVRRAFHNGASAI